MQGQSKKNMNSQQFYKCVKVEDFCPIGKVQQKTQFLWIGFYGFPLVQRSFAFRSLADRIALALRGQVIGDRIHKRHGCLPFLYEIIKVPDEKCYAQTAKELVHLNRYPFHDIAIHLALPTIIQAGGAWIGVAS